MSAPKHIFIVGAAGSGKTEFARLLAAELRTEGQGLRTEVVTAEPLALSSRSSVRWRIAECGDVLIRMLAFIQAHGPWPGCEPADLWAAFIRKRKEEYRRQLRALGDLLALRAPGCLIDECADNGEIVVGARRKAELEGFYTKYGAMHLDDVMSGRIPHAWIFIERPGTGLANDSFDREFFEKFCRHHIINRGDLAALEKEAAFLAAALKG